MKTPLILLPPILVMTLTALAASEQETIQERLVRVELKYAASIASGLGNSHPKVKELKAELDVLSKLPDIRTKEYWKILEDSETMLKVDLAGLTAKGLGSTHPKISEIKMQIGVIDVLQKKKR